MRGARHMVTPRGAEGRYVHVYVDDNGRPVPLRDATRRALESLVVVDEEPERTVP